MDTDLKNNSIKVIAYELEKHPQYVEISYCVDKIHLYDYILFKISDYLGGLKEMVEYRLIGNKSLFRTVTKWTPEDGWIELPKLKEPAFYDIRDCYAIVCTYRDNGWKLLKAS